MTTKTARNVMYVALLAAIVIPLSTVGYVDADNVKGKTLIKSEKSDSDIPLRDERKNLRIMLSEAETESSKATIQEQIDQLNERISQWYADHLDKNMYDLAREKQDLLGDVLKEEVREIGRESAFEALPWTSKGYDYVDNALEVTIVPEAFTEENIPKYIEKIRSIVGDEVNLTLSPAAVATVNGIQAIDSPLRQFKMGIPIDEIQCNEEFVLMTKSSNGSPVCVTPETKQKLIERGWAKPI